MSTEHIDLPALHRSANIASTRAQFEYITCLRATLILLVLGTLANAVSIESPDLRGIVLWSSAIGLAVSVILSFAIRLRKQDKIWFAARALAESVKTMSWRYMMASEPYDSTTNDLAAIDKRFQEDLKRLIKTEKEVFGSLGPADSGASQITEGMRKVRNAEFKTRLQIYVRSRIQDQQSWYGEKARENAKNATIFFWTTTFFQLIAVVFAFRYASAPAALIHPAGFFGAVATALIAWVQVRRHDELAKSYSLASHELGSILIAAERVDSPEHLADFVQDAENAISREHTLWLARRDAR